LISKSCFLKIARANGLAAVLAGALHCCLESVLKECAGSLCEVTGSHHVVLLDNFLDLRSDDVGHEIRGEEVDGEILAVKTPSARQKSSSNGEFGLSKAIDGIGILLGIA